MCGRVAQVDAQVSKHFGCRCSNALNKDGTRLRVDLQHLKAFDEDLGHMLEENPAEYLPSVQFHPARHTLHPPSSLSAFVMPSWDHVHHCPGRDVMLNENSSSRLGFEVE